MNFLRTSLLLSIFIPLFGCKSTAPNKTSKMDFWLTNDNKSVLFQKQPGLSFVNTASENATIEVSENKTYQEIDGFGYTLTGGSAQLIGKMNAPEREKLLKELFQTDGNNIGISYLRVSIGASDLDDRVFSYNDLPEGQTDLELQEFSLENDHRTGLIQLLKDILAINPKIKILGSPWSAPTWMKTNNNVKGGSLKPEYFEVYARYFAKYIKSMQAEGIAIDAITIQNEPLHPGNTPSMYMEAPDQGKFIKNNLGPLFLSAGIKTKIILYDHNCDKPEYPMSILEDAEANQYIDGSGFHLYGGKITALSTVHDAFPNKHIYFTEQWNGGPEKFKQDIRSNVENLVIGATRNWSRNVLQWNLAADPNYDPHTDNGGCTTCLGAITIDGSTVMRNVAYYSMAHASKFVRPGSVRIESNIAGKLENVAFKTPDGKKVLIVLNTSETAQQFNIKSGDKITVANLAAGSVGTYVW